MKALVDVHTHTVSSGHAYSTIDENMKAASTKGLEILAMTDHAPGMPGSCHMFHFANLKAIPGELHGVQLLKGVEANIINYNGAIDMPEELIASLDIVIASLHPPCIEFADEETVTRGIEKVMENPYVSIIGHPGDNRYPMDWEKVVLAAKKTGTLLEVNNASLKPGSFRPGVRENLIQMLKYCKQYNVPVVMGSDAHFYTEIGEFKESIELLEEINFPEELVLNTSPQKLASFIKQKRLK